MYVCMYTLMGEDPSGYCMYVCMFICMYTCMYECIYVCMNVCIIDCVTIIAATIPGIGREKSGTSNSPGEVDIIIFFS